MADDVRRNFRLASEALISAVRAEELRLDVNADDGPDRACDLLATSEKYAQKACDLATTDIDRVLVNGILETIRDVAAAVEKNLT